MSLELPVLPKIFHRPLFHLVVIAVLTTLAYSNTFQVPFVFDDVEQIVENPVVHDLDFFKNPSMARDLPTWHGLHRRTVGYFTLALNYQFGGTDVTGYHIFNLAIHILAAFLVYRLVLLTLRLAYRDREPSDSLHLAAFLVALLFAIHPIQTQAVTYIVQRLSSLTGFFALLSLTSYIDARLSLEKQRLGRSLGLFLLCLAAAVAAMKTKENAFTFPVVIVLYDFLFLPGSLRLRLATLFPVLATMLIIPLSMTWKGGTVVKALGSVDAVSPANEVMPRLDYLLTQFRVIVEYLRLLVFPAGQSVDHAFAISNHFFTPSVFASFFFLASLLGLGLFLCGSRLWKRYRDRLQEARPEPGLIGFGVLWFFITLAVESSIIPIDDAMAEHRLYLPSVGFFFALTVCGWWILRRMDMQRRDARLMTLIVMTVLIGTLSWATWSRNLVWKDQITLWLDTVAKNPQNARAYGNVGAYYDSRGEHQKAIEYFRQALSVDPDFAKALLGMGIAHAGIGELDTAIYYYQKAVSVQPNNPEALYNLGVAYMSKGMMGPAARAFQAALQLKPTMSQARLFLQYTQRQMKD